MPASRLEDDIFRPPLKMPAAPEHLKGEALAEYLRLGAILLARGTIAEVDRGALSMLASSWATYTEAETVLAALTPDEIVDPLSGRVHVAMKVSDRAMRQVLALSRLFGLTPASRNSVSQNGPPEPGGGGTGWDQFGAERTNA